MSFDFAVRAVDLDKRYELGETASLTRTLAAVRHKLGGPAPHQSHVVAVDNLSFEIARGESFAILGRNGSGKSTLVSLISGVTVPTGGSVAVVGSVMPLLTIGAGFNGDLTGRENVHLFGAMLGLDREAIRSAMPGISEFSEIAPEHLDTPIKRYSSGMRGRLFFSAALRLPADIYILDEVLSAADDGFKGKAAAHFDEMRKRGATIIFISHELPLLRRVCDRGMWLHDGRIRAQGAMDDLAPEYTEFMDAAAKDNATRTELLPPTPARRFGLGSS
jgi:ABC-type polysaccharide/polyol phosphate transport system ATPase subunit